jgi:hypothetical protein
MSFLSKFIKNVRFGFATNSSSSHSLVYLTHPEHAIDDMPYGNEFGWNMFHAFTAEAKTAYYLAQSNGAWDSPLGYVDHQSVGTLSPEQILEPHIGIIGGNDNGDSTTEELRSLHDAGIIDIEKMREMGLIDKWVYEDVMGLDHEW